MPIRLASGSVVSLRLTDAVGYCVEDSVFREVSLAGGGASKILNKTITGLNRYFLRCVPVASPSPTFAIQPAP